MEESVTEIFENVTRSYNENTTVATEYGDTRLPHVVFVIVFLVNLTASLWYFNTKVRSRGQRWEELPRPPFLVYMDVVRISLFVALVQQSLVSGPFVLPVVIWIYFDVNVVYIICLLLDNNIIRKFYLCYGIVSYFAGLQIRVGLLVNCYKQCEDDDALFYLAFLVPLLYGAGPAGVLLFYLIHLLLVYSAGSHGEVGLPSRPVSILATGVALVGVLGVINLPGISGQTALDTWTIKCAFFCVMLTLTATTIVYKNKEDGNRMDVAPDVATLYGISMVLVTYAYQVDIGVEEVTYLQPLWIAPIIVVTLVSDAMSIKKSIVRRSRVADQQAAAAQPVRRPVARNIKNRTMSAIARMVRRRERTEDCCICWDNFGEDESIGMLGTCGHYFHQECIKAWFAETMSCPTCRSASGLGNIRVLNLQQLSDILNNQTDVAVQNRSTGDVSQIENGENSQISTNMHMTDMNNRPRSQVGRSRPRLNDSAPRRPMTAQEQNIMSAWM